MLKKIYYLFTVATVCILFAGCAKSEQLDLQSPEEGNPSLKAAIVSNSIYTIKNRNSGKFLDVSNSSASDGATIVQWPATGGNNQRWQFISVGSGYYAIKNVNSGKYMDIEGASTADGAKNIQWTYAGATNQQWSLVSAGSGYYKIKNRKSGKVLDVSGASTADGAQNLQWADNGGYNQHWFFQTRTLLWSEEFNYTGAPNTAYWNYETGYLRNAEAQYYQSSNAYVNGSNLVITAKQNDGGHTYTSASIYTGTKKTFGKGYFEMRAKIPTATGTWCAWWALGKNALTGSGWPYCGEIDMLEWYNNGTHANVMNQNGVWDGVFTWRDVSFSNSYHTWGMYLDDNWIRLYVDGVEVNNYAQSSAWINGYNPFLSQEMYMLVNLALGGSNGGSLTGLTFPQYYYVDYIRYYSIGY